MMKEDELFGKYPELDGWKKTPPEEISKYT